MSSIANAPPAGKAGVSAPRASTAGVVPKAPLGYKFDAVHKRIKHKIRDGILEPIDAVVMAILLDLPRIGYTCWAARARVAREAGNVSERTIQRSWHRLFQAGEIEQYRVPKPDPDCPKNRTGWRIVLCCMAPEDRERGVGPGRGPWYGKKKPRKGDQAPKEAPSNETPVPPVSTSNETPMAPSNETPMARKQCVRADHSQNPTELEESSSSLSRKAAAPELDDDDSSLRQDREGAVEAARHFHGNDEAKARAFIAGVASDVERPSEVGPRGRTGGLDGRWDCYAFVLRKAANVKTPIGDLHAYVMSGARPLVVSGIPPEPVAVAPRAKIDREANEARELAARKAREAPDTAPPDGEPEDIERYVGWIKDRRGPGSLKRAGWRSLTELAELENPLAAAALEDLERDGFRPPPSEGG